MRSRTLSVSLRGELELTARVAWWAGRARGLLREFADGEWRMRDLVERILSDLFELARRYDLEGIESLDRRWVIDDFGICEYQRHLFEGTPLRASEHEQQVLWNACSSVALAGAPRERRQSGARVLSAAAASLGSDHPLVAEVRVHYADRLSRASKSSPPPASTRVLRPRCARPSRREAAASRRHPVDAGAGVELRTRLSPEHVFRSRRHSRQACVPRRGQLRPPEPAVRDTTAVQVLEVQVAHRHERKPGLAGASRGGDRARAYDVAFLLPGAEAGELRGLVDACEAAEIPIVRLASDYDEDSFANAAAGFFG